MEPQNVLLQLCTAVISVPPEKAGQWKAKGWQEIKERLPFVEPPKPLEVGKATEE